MGLTDAGERVKSKMCGVDISTAQQVASVTSGSNRVVYSIELKGVKSVCRQVPREILVNIQDVHQFDKVKNFENAMLPK